MKYQNRQTNARLRWVEEHYGIIRADLARSGTPIGPNDLMIASSARALDLTLVTHNPSEFSRVAGLRIEDWER